MTYSEEQLWDLLNQVYRMPYGSAQIALVEQVVAHADAQRLTELAFAARLRATTSYVYGGEPARSFVTFSWCLAEFDRNPTLYERQHGTLLWQFKATINALTRFPEVPLDRTYAVLDDMQRRWLETGHTMHAVHSHRHLVARHVGDLEAAEEHYDRWCTTPRDELSDCVGCDPSSKAGWLSSRGRDEEAIALAEPVLAGQLTCSEQPQGILVTLLKPYLRTGRLEQARDAHRRAYRLNRPNLADLREVAEHIEFCAVTGNEARGVEILERHLGWFDRAPSPYAAMWFAATGALVLRRSAGIGHGVSVNRPAHGDRAASRVDGAELADELAATALDLAARFDRRNSTDNQSRSMRRILDATPLVEHLPLSPTATRRSVTPPTGAPRPGDRPGVGAAAGAASEPVPSVQPAPPQLGDNAGPDEYLDLSDELSRDYRGPDAADVMLAFDERFAGEELTVRQRARRADNHAVEVAQRGELTEAETVWRTAAQLYGEAGDEVGRGRALARIGVLLCETGRVDEGLAMLRPATDRLVADGPPDQRYSAVARLADCMARLGMHEEALAELERAETLATDLDPRHHARAQAELAVEKLWVLRAMGRVDEVRRGMHEALELARGTGLAPLIVRAHVLIGGWYEQAGDALAAADALADASAVASEDDVRAWLRTARANLLAETERAAEVLDDLVETVAERTAAGDLLGAARARHPLAIAYLNLGRHLDAAEVAEEELAFLVQSADDVDPTPVRYLLATVYQRLGQPDEAIAQLEAITQTCAAAGNRAGVAQIGIELGDLLDRLDRDAAAAARYLEAAQAYEEAGRPVDALHAWRRHAMSTFWAEGPAEAVPIIARVDGIAAAIRGDHGPHLVWERSMLQYDAARVFRAHEDLGEAITRAGTSADGFRSIDAMPQVAAAESLLAELLLGDGRSVEAEAAARRSLAAVSDGDDVGRPAMLLVEALVAQGRAEDAAACRARYGLNQPDVPGGGSIAPPPR